MKRLFANTWNILKNTVHGFFEDHGYLHASSLTYYSMLAVVPMMAVSLGIAQAFGFEKALEHELLERFYEHKEVILKAFEFAHSLLREIRESMLASVSAIVLLFFILILFMSIEYSFNVIWKVKRSRPWPRKISDYFTLIILCPVFFVAASTLTFYFTQQLETAVTGTVIGKAISPLISIFYRLIPLFLVWLLFTLLYLIMPNTNIHTPSAIIAGVAAGTVYQIVQWVYITFQIGVAQYNTIYGSFAALPLFLLWLQVSWVIVLLGAELGYHIERHFRS